MSQQSQIFTVQLCLHLIGIHELEDISGFQIENESHRFKNGSHEYKFIPRNDTEKCALNRPHKIQP
jgi:hypothetical protein